MGWDHERAVGYTDCGVHDRWVTWEGGAGGRGEIASIPGPAAAITYVVDPTLRRRGYGQALIQALLDLDELAHLRVFATGVEPDNTASIRCITGAGFRPIDATPDWEGIVYYYARSRRSAAIAASGDADHCSGGIDRR